MSKSEVKGSVSKTQIPVVIVSVGTFAVPAGLFIDWTFVKEAVVLFTAFNIFWPADDDPIV